MRFPAFGVTLRIVREIGSGRLRSVCDRKAFEVIRLASMKHYTVTAKRVHDLWELDITGVGITQSTTARAAEEVIRDYLDCLGVADADSALISIDWHGGPEGDARIVDAGASIALRSELRELPVVDPRAVDDIIGYDEDGLPA